ncbi:hypothetical protein D3C80_2054490 [compost metagenome]
MTPAATIVETLHTGQRTANGVGIVAMELIAVPTEKGFDTLNLHWGAGRFNPVLQVFTS